MKRSKLSEAQVAMIQRQADLTLDREMLQDVIKRKL